MTELRLNHGVSPELQPGSGTRKVGFYGETPRPLADWTEHELDLVELRTKAKLAALAPMPRWTVRRHRWRDNDRRVRAAFRRVLAAVEEARFERSIAELSPTDQLRARLARIGLVAE